MPHYNKSQDLKYAILRMFWKILWVSCVCILWVSCE